MNDEIKEMLDYFQKDVDKYEESKRYLMQKYGYDEETIDNISQHERHINTKILLDYITNLQQENERLKEIKPCILNFQECYVVKDYKSRCEKASEYIKEHYPTSTINDQDDKYNLLNILQNGSENK